MTGNRPSDRAIAQAFAEFQEATIAVPVGHYDDTKGSSTYNWRRSFESAVLARAAELDATAASVVVGEDARDARRYRFLRNAEWGELFYWHDDDHHKHNPVSKSASERLDAAIDQALTAALAGD